MEILVKGDEREVMSFHGVITQLIFYLNFLNLCFRGFFLFCNYEHVFLLLSDVLGDIFGSSRLVCVCIG